eukprot:6178409-Amphidinium_carterae.1
MENKTKDIRNDIQMSQHHTTVAIRTELLWFLQRRRQKHSKSAEKVNAMSEFPVSWNLGFVCKLFRRAARTVSDGPSQTTSCWKVCENLHPSVPTF